MPPPAIGEGADNGTATALGYLIFNARDSDPARVSLESPDNRTGDVAKQLYNVSAGMEKMHFTGER